MATPYGKGIAIAEVAGLHRVIAKHLIEYKLALTGVEFRFLRMELELSQGEFAEVLGITEQSVSLGSARDACRSGPIAFCARSTSITSRATRISGQRPRRSANLTAGNEV